MLYVVGQIVAVLLVIAAALVFVGYFIQSKQGKQGKSPAGHCGACSNLQCSLQSSSSQATKTELAHGCTYKK